MTRRVSPAPFAGVPLVSPLQTSVVYTAETPSELDAVYVERSGYTYSREGHPNAATIAGMIDRLEGTEGGIMTGSGMGAVALALLASLDAGDHALGSSQLYGRSLRLMVEELPRLGIATDLFDPTDVAGAAALIRPGTRAMLVEVVSNPTLRVADITGLAELCRAHGITLIIDNTFTTPLGFRALEHGADIVLHSVTKLLSGHSDAMLGWVAARHPDVNTRLDLLSATWGTTPAPFDCWMAERGLLSFPLRYERAEANAAALADALAGLPGVARVLYPLRPDHPDHNRATGLLGGHGGTMVSFEIDGGRAAADALAKTVPVAFAPTLGDISTTLSHAATSSHRALTEEGRAELGISEGFFRISVGVEPIDELVAGFERAVDAAARAA